MKGAFSVGLSVLLIYWTGWSYLKYEGLVVLLFEMKQSLDDVEAGTTGVIITHPSCVFVGKADHGYYTFKIHDEYFVDWHKSELETRLFREFFIPVVPWRST